MRSFSPPFGAHRVLLAGNDFELIRSLQRHVWPERGFYLYEDQLEICGVLILCMWDEKGLRVSAEARRIAFLAHVRLTPRAPKFLVVRRRWAWLGVRQLTFSIAREISRVSTKMTQGSSSGRTPRNFFWGRLLGWAGLSVSQIGRSEAPTISSS